jgi:hypothetical protein
VRTSQRTLLFRTVDRMIDSPTHYWVVMVSDVVWALAFLAVGWVQYTGPVSMAIAT